MTASSYILGLSDSHDAGAALLKDGVLIAAANEERFSRRKMDWGFPRRAIDAVLARAGITPDRIDGIAVAGTSRLGAVPINNDFSDEQGRYSGAQKLAEALDRIPVVSGMMRWPLSVAAYRSLGTLGTGSRLRDVGAGLRAMGFPDTVIATLGSHDHHACHVASAYYACGLDDAIVLSNDGFGDALSCMVSTGRQGRLETISTSSFFDSLGVWYNYATDLCGFSKSHHAGKTTGLAAFGEAKRTRDIFAGLCSWDEARGRYVNRGPIFRNAIEHLRQAVGDASREDIAAGVQAHFENVLVQQAQHFLKRTGLRRIVLVGGIHANVKVNQRIAALADVEAMAVFPNMGDGGLAAGAAWLGWAAKRSAGAIALPPRLDHVYLGPSIGERDAAEALAGSGLDFEQPADLADAVAAALAEGKIVARAEGAMEYGPRALGNRSILYAATDRTVNTWLNARLKRTEFMPFAPVCRSFEADRYFRGIGPANAYPAEFMTVTFDVTPECARDFPAITHVDGTARPQVLRREKNPGYHAILDRYSERTGQGILVNTSFNMHEEPIVCTAEEAIRSFRASAIDCLALGPFLVRQPG